MPRDKTGIALIVLMGLVAVMSVGALAYRLYYHGGANESQSFFAESVP
jgi:hypothetical protein